MSLASPAFIKDWISDDYVQRVIEENPHPQNELGEFVYYRTYSRWLPEENRREYWHETCRRAVAYSVNLAYKHLKKVGMKPNVLELQEEARNLFRAQYNVKQFLSGRTNWVGGADSGVADLYPTSNFNCAYLTVRKWEDLGDLFYNLMIGVGVGYKSTPKLASQMPKVRIGTKLEFSDYKPVDQEERLEHSELVELGNGFAKIYVGDSKEGWVEAFLTYMNILTEPRQAHIHTVKINFNSIRPKGEKLLRFGGTASGHESLKAMFEGIDKVFKGTIDPSLIPIEVDADGFGFVRPVHILDIGNLIGYNVVVGGVRRTAEIFLMDSTDWESIWAKYGMNGFWQEAHFKHHEALRDLLVTQGREIPDWFDALGVRSFDATVNVNQDGITKYEEDGSLAPFNFGRPLHHRRMSNNSIAYVTKPDRAMFDLQFMLLQGEGEPCFVNIEQAVLRRGLNEDPDDIGLNPCVEIILASYGLCNLTTLNLVAFIIEKNGQKMLDLDELFEAQRRSARAGVRMTLVELELTHWHKRQQQDRLTGCSLTGVKDAFAMCGIDDSFEEFLLGTLGMIAREEADRYAKQLRIPAPLLVTAVKPEGTISQVAGGVSSGLHWSHSPFYIRRIRINAHDPLAQVALHLGWTVNPEVGTPGSTHEERMANASTWVIDFPIASGATVTKYDVTAQEQLDTYFRFQDLYTEHNSSNTITVRDDEWQGVANRIWDNWDDFVGVSFLKLDGHTYDLAPYEAITEEQYHELKAKMQPFDISLLHALESQETEKDLDNMQSCEGGACPIF